METKLTYADYENASKQLFKQLFGKDVLNQLENTPLKSIDWDGAEVTTPEITATCFNVKQRFSPNGIESATDSDRSLLDLFIQTLFHFGYQQSYDANEMNRDYMKLLQSFVKEKAKRKNND